MTTAFRKDRIGSPVVFVGPGFRVKPPLAQPLDRVVQFWLVHWQWLMGTMIAIIGITGTCITQ